MSKEYLILWDDYVIYKDGRIYSKGYNKNRLLKGTLFPNGYVRVKLKCVDGKYRMFMWHRVIYTYFNGAIPEGYQVNHIDENKQNNALSNLNLMTPKENCNWGTHNEKISASKIGKNNNSLTSKPVVAVNNEGNVVYVFPSAKEAGRHGFDASHVDACCRGERNKHGGLRWFFKKDWDDKQ